jgi:prepilin-type N-terminal cleavage/methylation domain-containing protein
MTDDGVVESMATRIAPAALAIHTPLESGVALRLPPHSKIATTLSTAGFPTCCVADFQIGGASESRGACGLGNPRHSRLGSLRHNSSTRAFTLIELLVVIAIIGVLAALIIPVAGSVGRVKKINTAQAELQQLETALENYKAKYGVYPPSNAAGVVTNALFYELTGVTNVNNSYYQPLDGSAIVNVSDYTGRFGLGGVVNCSKGGGEDAVYAKDFLPGLKANEIASTTNGSGSTFFYLVTSVSGPDITYQPLPGYSFNPFRYLYPGINNPNSYDLWVKLVINGQTNLVSNWSQQVQHNTSLP